MRRLAIVAALLAIAGCEKGPDKPERLTPGEEMMIADEESRDAMVMRYPMPGSSKKDIDFISSGTKVRVVSDDVEPSPDKTYEVREIVVLPLEGRLQGGSVWVGRHNLKRMGK